MSSGFDGQLVGEQDVVGRQTDAADLRVGDDALGGQSQLKVGNLGVERLLHLGVAGLASSEVRGGARQLETGIHLRVGETRVVAGRPAREEEGKLWLWLSAEVQTPVGHVIGAALD